jgi:hypothetical protein
LAQRYNRLVHFLATIIFALAITLCLVLAYRHLNIESEITLTVFNLFFISLFYQLNGSITRKAAILTCGNILGLTWNYVFQNVSSSGSIIFGVSFNIFFSVIYPLLSLIWIVPFWSLSLSVLPKPPRLQA